MRLFFTSSPPDTHNTCAERSGTRSGYHTLKKFKALRSTTCSVYGVFYIFVLSMTDSKPKKVSCLSVFYVYSFEQDVFVRFFTRTDHVSHIRHVLFTLFIVL